MKLKVVTSKLKKKMRLTNVVYIIKSQGQN